MHRMKIAPCSLAMADIIKGDMPEVFIDGRIKINQIVAVENDSLGIGFCIPDTKGKVKFVAVICHSPSTWHKIRRFSIHAFL